MAAVIAVLFFGSNFVPVKKFETGDGRLSLILGVAAKLFFCFTVDICFLFL